MVVNASKLSGQTEQEIESDSMAPRSNFLVDQKNKNDNLTPVNLKKISNNI